MGNRRSRLALFQQIQHETLAKSCLYAAPQDLTFLNTILQDERLMQALARKAHEKGGFSAEFLYALQALQNSQDREPMMQILKAGNIGTWLGAKMQGASDEVLETRTKDLLGEILNESDHANLLNQLYLIKNGDIRSLAGKLGLKDGTVDEQGIYYAVAAQRDDFHVNGKSHSLLNAFENDDAAKVGIFNVLYGMHWMTVVIIKEGSTRNLILHDSYGQQTGINQNIQFVLEQYYNQSNKVLGRVLQNPHIEQQDSYTCGLRSMVNAKYYAQFSPQELLLMSAERLFADVLPPNEVLRSHCRQTGTAKTLKNAVPKKRSEGNKDEGAALQERADKPILLMSEEQKMSSKLQPLGEKEGYRVSEEMQRIVSGTATLKSKAYLGTTKDIDIHVHVATGRCISSEGESRLQEGTWVLFGPASKRFYEAIKMFANPDAKVYYDLANDIALSQEFSQYAYVTNAKNSSAVLAKAKAHELKTALENGAKRAGDRAKISEKDELFTAYQLEKAQLLQNTSKEFDRGSGSAIQDWTDLQRSAQKFLDASDAIRTKYRKVQDANLAMNALKLTKCRQITADFSTLALSDGIH